MFRTKTDVALERLVATIETQQEILREEEELHRELSAKRESALKLAKDCQKELAASELRQAAMGSAIAQSQALLDLAAPAPQQVFSTQGGTNVTFLSGSASVRPIARLGRQHYMIFAALRAKGPISAHELAPLSGVDVRRVKQVMSGDLERGYVVLSTKGFTLTDTGLDILGRFEAFRFKEGTPLPSLADKQVDAEAETDVLMEEEDAA